MGTNSIRLPISRVRAIIDLPRFNYILDSGRVPAHLYYADGLTNCIQKTKAEWSSDAPKVFAAEPAIADDAFESMRTGIRQPERPPHTVAEGLRTSLGDITFPIVRDGVREVLLVEEQEIITSTVMFILRAKLLIEPSAGVVVAALLRYRNRFAGKRGGVILTGGNVDLVALGTLAEGIDG